MKQNPIRMMNFKSSTVIHRQYERGKRLFQHNITNDCDVHSAVAPIVRPRIRATQSLSDTCGSMNPPHSRQRGANASPTHALAPEPETVARLSLSEKKDETGG